MFRKKATPWAMAMAMMGMTGAIEAQTIDKNWVRQNADNPRQARQAILFGNTQVRMAESLNRYSDNGNPPLSFSEGVALYKDPYIDAAKAVGAPYVDIVSDPNAPRTRETCWGAAAWSETGNHGQEFNQAIVQEIAERGLPPIGMFPGTEKNIYIQNACIAP